MRPCRPGCFVGRRVRDHKACRAWGVGAVLESCLVCLAEAVHLRGRMSGSRGWVQEKAPGLARGLQRVRLWTLKVQELEER